MLENADSVGVVVEAAFLPIIPAHHPGSTALAALHYRAGRCARSIRIYNSEALLRKASRDKPRLLWAEQRDEGTGYNIQSAYGRPRRWNNRVHHGV